VGPETLVFVFGVCTNFYGTSTILSTNILFWLCFSTHFSDFGTPVSSGSCWYGSLWRADNPAECTCTLHTSGGMMWSVGLGIIAPEPIEIS
jgi:hypothetical protein